MSTIIDGMPEDEYHAHPALSSTGARRLIMPGGPALFKWERDNPPPRKRAFELGTAAHSIVLGSGPDLHPIDATDWRKKATNEEATAARAEGKVPLLLKDYEAVWAMAHALLTHPWASVLFEDGKPEQTLLWHNVVDRRARLDWLGDGDPSDYKTTVDASPRAVERAIFRYGYHQQAAWYLDGLAHVGRERESFSFVFQEKHPPFLVNVVTLDPDVIDLGRELNEQAVTIYAECVERDEWPGYPVTNVSLPPWLNKDRYEPMEDVA